MIDALRLKYPQIVGPHKDDICYATQNRQEAVRDIVPEANVVLVLGSQNSSNSQRLAELARSVGKSAYLIDRVSELRDEWFKPTDTVLITAGASAPEDHVQDCVEYYARSLVPCGISCRSRGTCELPIAARAASACESLTWRNRT